MKKLLLICLLLCFTFAACAKPEQAPVYTPTPLAWDISTPPPMPVPSIDVDLSDARERGYVEIDIDKSDGYRDFVLESRITDDYGESTFFRLINGKYIDLGSIEDYITAEIGTPHITLDGMGYIYVNQPSAHLGWARIERIYTVVDNALTEVPPLHHVYYPIDETEFTVRDTVSVYAVGLTSEQLKGILPADAPAFAWDSIGGKGRGKRRLLSKDDRVRVFGTDERGAVGLDFEGEAYLLPMMTEAQSDVWGDLVADGRFFHEYFFNEAVEDYFHRS